MNCATVLREVAQRVILCHPDTTPHWSAFIAPALVVLSIGVAIWGVFNTRSVARRKATLDLIEKRESAEHYQQIHKVFRDTRLADGFLALADPRTEDARAQRKAVLDFLNHYEMVAIGIRRNILDERMYRDWMEGAFVRDWNAAAEFIQSERWRRNIDNSGWVYRASIFANYQWAAERWSSEARRLVEGDQPQPTSPIAIGDEHLPESRP